MKMKMKMNLKPFLWLLLVATSYAQIVPGPATGGGAQCTASGGTTNCSAPSTLTASVVIGDTVIAVLSANVNYAADRTLTGCSQDWPAPSRYATGVSGSAQTMMIWIIPHATVADMTCQLTVSGLTGANAFAWQRYSGVTSVGTMSASNTQLTSVTTLSSPAMTASNAGNFIVGILSASNTTNVAPTAVVSPAVSRRNVGITLNAGVAAGTIIADSQATFAGEPITVAATTTSTVAYHLRAAVELVVAPTNHTAQLSEAMHTVLMNPSRNMNYELPASGLSPTWCTWFMPVDSHTHQLDPTTVHVNGQTNHITIPSWQMTRICQDTNGNFWASPPLLAGTGISITPSPTGLTISSSGTPGVSGMTYIAGGTTHIPGTVQVAPDTCNDLYVTTGSTTPSATGVLQSDVVNWSLQPLTPGWNQSHMSFHAIAYAGSITWRGCNGGTTAYTPAARDINWYVARPSAGSFAAKHRRIEHKKVARPKK